MAEPQADPRIPGNGLALGQQLFAKEAEVMDEELTDGQAREGR
jgi:hypothetical protein